MTTKMHADTAIGCTPAKPLARLAKFAESTPISRSIRSSRNLMRLQALLLVALVSSLMGCSVDAPTYTAGDGASGDDAADMDGPTTDGPSVDAMTGSWSEPESLALNSSQFEGAPRAAPSE